MISNLPPINYFLKEEYHYQNQDGSFQFTEQAGSTQGFDIAEKRFADFVKQNLNSKNNTLYRTFTFKPWKFWEWWQMIVHYERWQLPLIDRRID